MKILTTSDGYVDFEKPIHITDDQTEKFITLMKSLFPNIETKNIQEPIKEFALGKGDKKGWGDLNELAMLLGPEDNDTISSKTGRSTMSIRAKRGDFVAQFTKWAIEKGYTYSPNHVDKNLIEKFRKETKII